VPGRGPPRRADRAPGRCRAGAASAWRRSAPAAIFSVIDSCLTMRDPTVPGLTRIALFSRAEPTAPRSFRQLPGLLPLGSFSRHGRAFSGWLVAS
jgi:hypothetical protein